MPSWNACFAFFTAASTAVAPMLVATPLSCSPTIARNCLEFGDGRPFAGSNNASAWSLCARPCVFYLSISRSPPPVWRGRPPLKIKNKPFSDRYIENATENFDALKLQEFKAQTMYLGDEQIITRRTPSPPR